MRQETFSPWNPFYMLLPLRALGYDADPAFPALQQRLTEYYSHRRCHGLFSGFPDDTVHMVTSYAGITGIALIGTDAAYELIDRQAAYRALIECKLPNGAFMTCRGQEHDVRSTFAATIVADVLNILTPAFIENTAAYVLSCQSYDGGLSPRPGLESHGGYVHCGVGIMKILGRLDDLNLPRLARWIATMQLEYSGGFCGRAHKLVDSCYSWWIGAAAKTISQHLGIPPFWNEAAMSQFLLQICQHGKGGFASRPPTEPDPFHTLYSIAGLCVCGKPQGLPEIDTLLACPKELVERMINYFRARPFVPE
jgi:protein farnesyltransferase subunit beta